MPPKPTHDIDFPDLSDRIVEILDALWAFICDVCFVLWSYIAGAFFAVWTWPPFETFRIEFTAALVDLCDYVGDHPVTALAISVLAFVAISSVLNVLRVCLLHGMGVRQRVVLLGTSRGPYYHSTGYGGNVRPKSRGSRRHRTVGAGSSSYA